MNLLSAADVEFVQLFEAGDVPPQSVDHRAHLRLAYVYLSGHGPDRAVPLFRESLVGFLRHHQIDPAKFHETLTQAWLQAVWHFMDRIGATKDSADFIERAVALHDPKVMLTHYSKEVLFSQNARVKFVGPDLEPIPRGATTSDPRATWQSVAADRER